MVLTWQRLVRSGKVRRARSHSPLWQQQQQQRLRELAHERHARLGIASSVVHCHHAHEGQVSAERGVSSGAAAVLAKRQRQERARQLGGMAHGEGGCSTTLVTARVGVEPWSDSPTVKSDSVRQYSDNPTVRQSDRSDRSDRSDSVRQCPTATSDRDMTDSMIPTCRTSIRQSDSSDSSDSPAVPTVPTVPTAPTGSPGPLLCITLPSLLPSFDLSVDHVHHTNPQARASASQGTCSCSCCGCVRVS